MVCEDEESLISKIWELYSKISSLKSLSPSENVDRVFTELVHTCIPPSSIDVTTLSKGSQDMRSNLIRLCGQAESLLERHYSSILASFENPLHHLHIFPYYSNYLKLGLLEFTLLSQHYSSSNHLPSKIAFVGSGPLPFTSIVLASHHLPSTLFHNYDLDPLANSMARNLFHHHEVDDGVSRRMIFHTADILDVTTELEEYDVVFLAALVGMDKHEKNRIIDHLAKHMAPGALLMLRSAHGARAFLYPVVDPCDLNGFQILSVFHPTDEVINSVVIARKYTTTTTTAMPLHHDHHEPLPNITILPNKCSDIQVFHPLIVDHQDFTIDEQLS